MFECGLEGISLKVIKKSQYEHSDGNEIVENTTATTTTATTTNTIENSQNEVHKGQTEEDTKQTKSVTLTPHLHEAGSSKNRKSILIEKSSKQPNENTTETSNTKEGEDATSKECVSVAKDTKNVSSCVIEVKVVWFNFAAPPRTPITRKIDYTR